MTNTRFLKNIFLITISAFGGPQGHLLAINNYLVEKEKLLTKQELINSYALCSSIPGATTTQLLCLIAYRKGGLKLVIPCMAIWILPSFLLLLMLALLFIGNDIFQLAEDIFFLFNPMVVAFMIFAALRYTDFYKNIKTKFILILTNVSLILIFFKHPFIIPIIFIINSLYAYYIVNGRISDFFRKFKRRFTINYRILTIYITLFVASGFLSEYSRKFQTSNRYYYNILEHNFRFGSFIYGGGDVLIPLMYEQYISRPSSTTTKRRNPAVLSLTKKELTTAAGVIRLIPGPVFVITAFTAPYLLDEFQTHQKIVGSFIATIAIFLPGILILLSIAPLWDKLFSNKSFSNILQGINLTVFSIMIASSIYLLYDLLYIESVSILQVLMNIFFIVTILIALYFKLLSHAQIALLSIFIGLVYHVL